MANLVLVNLGATFEWANDGSENSTLDMSGVVAGAAVQGVKDDLGDPRPWWYTVVCIIETGTAPTAGGTYEFYWSSSLSGTAATQNDGDASGASAGYKAASEAAWIKLLHHIGDVPVTNSTDTTHQKSFKFHPPTQFGQVIMRNNTDQTSRAQDTINSVRFLEMPREIQ